MTMREVVSAVVAIRRRRAAEQSFQAALRGLKLDPEALGAPPKREPEFTPDEDEKAERLMQELIARKKAQHQQGKPIGG